MCKSRRMGAVLCSLIKLQPKLRTKFTKASQRVSTSIAIRQPAARHTRPLLVLDVMAPQNIKIIYFNGRGRAELARLVLTAAGQDFEDIRLTAETWPAEKPNTPYGQLPVMEVDGKKFAQGVAMATYLAKEFNMHGDSNLQALEIDQVVQMVQDFVTFLVKMVYEKDETRKAEYTKTFMEVEIPKYMGIFEKTLKDNGTGYMVGDTLTLADLAIYDVIYNISKRPGGEGIMDAEKYPLLKKNYDVIESHEKISSYLANRKETPF